MPVLTNQQNRIWNLNWSRSKLFSLFRTRTNNAKGNPIQSFFFDVNKFYVLHYSTSNILFFLEIVFMGVTWGFLRKKARDQSAMYIRKKYMERLRIELKLHFMSPSWLFYRVKLFNFARYSLVSFHCMQNWQNSRWTGDVQHILCQNIHIRTQT